MLAWPVVQCQSLSLFILDLELVHYISEKDFLIHDLSILDLVPQLGDSFNGCKLHQIVDIDTNLYSNSMNSISLALPHMETSSTMWYNKNPIKRAWLLPLPYGGAS